MRRRNAEMKMIFMTYSDFNHCLTMSTEPIVKATNMTTTYPGTTPGKERITEAIVEIADAAMNDLSLGTAYLNERNNTAHKAITIIGPKRLFVMELL